MRSAKIFAVLLAVCAPALSACQTDGPAAQAAAPEAPQPPSRQQAALQCWMSVDKTHPNMGLDQRADIVTKCINEKMNSTAKAPAAAPPKSKT